MQTEVFFKMNNRDLDIKVSSLSQTEVWTNERGLDNDMISSPSRTKVRLFDTNVWGLDLDDQDFDIKISSSSQINGQLMMIGNAMNLER